MVSTSPPRLLPSTRALCQRIPYNATSDVPTLAQVLGRLGVAVLLLAGTTLLLPLLPSRHPGSGEAQWFGAAMVGLLLAGGYLYQAVWRPLFGTMPAYRLMGDFKVREKFSVFGQKVLRIGDGDEQQVRIHDELYEQLRAGDWVRVVYTADGELVSISKLAVAPKN